MTTKAQYEKREVATNLARHGISYDDAMTLRALERILHSWAEKECGNDHGAIQREETTGRPYYRPALGGAGYPVNDLESSALARLAKVMARYPLLLAYHQTDPRGCALYIVPKLELGCDDIASCYTRGTAV